MAEFKKDYLIIPKENLRFNTNNNKWQEIRRASNIFSSLIINLKENLSDEKFELNKTSLSELYLYSDSVAFITNMSFSVELALKCILEYQGNFNTRDYTHDLDKLFEKLNSKTKRFIIKYLNTYYFCLDKIIDEKDFINRLNPVGNLFAKYRYFFDDKYDLSNYNEDLSILIFLFDLLIKFINYKLK